MAIRKLDVAVIGAGVGREHLESYAELPQLFRIASLCDLSRQRLDELGRRFAIPHLTCSFEQVLERPEIDVVDICTPPNLHFEMARQAIEAGKHVVCEKPLFSSVRQADRMAEFLSGRSQQLMPIFQYRFGNGLQKLKTLVDEGLAGRAYLTSLETHWRRDDDYFAAPWQWRGSRTASLGGCFLAHAIHAHDCLNYIVGPSESVQAFTATRVNSTIEVEDCAVASLRMADGSLATSSATLGSSGEMSRLRFCFQHLTAQSAAHPYSPGREPWQFVGQNQHWQQRIDRRLQSYPPRREGFVRQFELFHRALVEGEALPVSLADGRRSIELVTALYDSAETGNAVALPITAEHRKYESLIAPV